MRTPWFMHAPRGRNTPFGVYPTNVGTFVRTFEEGRVEVSWYPTGSQFTAGANREVTRVITPGRDLDEEDVDQTVEDFMHAHPALCMVTSRIPDGQPLTWIATRDTGDARQSRIDVLNAEDGDYVRTHRAGFVAIRFVPEGRGDEVEICRLADACGDETALARADARVRRHMGPRLAPAA